MDGVLYTYYYEGGKLMKMTIGDTTTMDFFYDQYGRPFAVKHNTRMLYYVLNEQGDVTRLIHGNGDGYATYHYDAWGNITYATDNQFTRDNPLRYRGYVYDTETGFYYLQSRYYDPALGRFLNADSFASTGQGLLGNNMFAYCGNNPTVRDDALGHFGEVILPTIHDIKQLAEEEIDNAVTPSYTTNKESVRIDNSDKILTPWVQFGYSFYLNHISEYKDYFAGTTMGMTFEWMLHNLGSVGFGFLGNLLDSIGMDGEAMHNYSERCEDVDLGPTIYHDNAAKHGKFSDAMKGMYVLISPYTAVIDAIVKWTSE